MKKFIKNQTMTQDEETNDEVGTMEISQESKAPQEELIDAQETPHHKRKEIEDYKFKKAHKPHVEKPALGIAQKINLVSLRTLSTTDRFIQSLTRAYEHIFIGDEKVENANFEKEYGLKYYAKNDYKNALKHFENLEQNGEIKDVDVVYMMGVCYVTGEEYKKAAEYFAKADELKPNDFDIISQLAKCLLALENFEGALDNFKKSAHLAPDEADTYYHCANCYEKLEQIEDAKKMYKKAIDINPREAVYYHALGFLYENMGDHKDAIVCFKKAMDLERIRGGGDKNPKIATRITNVNPVIFNCGPKKESMADEH